MFLTSVWFLSFGLTLTHTALTSTSSSSSSSHMNKQDEQQLAQAAAAANVDLTNAPTSRQEQAERQKMEEQREEERQAFLAAILDPSARERLARVKLVKPEKARGVEQTIINAARQGKLGKVSEKMLIDMLSTVSESGIGETKVGSITFERKKSAFDEDSDSDDDAW